MSGTAVAQRDDALLDRVHHSLAEVLDPCSVFNGTRLSFVELGMVDAVEQRGPGHVCVRLILDDPTCLYLAQIHHDIRQAALSVPGIDRVDFELVGDELWTDERATEHARTTMRRQQLPIWPVQHSPEDR